MRPKKLNSLKTLQSQSLMISKLIRLYQSHGYRQMDIPVHLKESLQSSDLDTVRFIDSEKGIVKLQNDPTQSILELLESETFDCPLKICYEAKTFKYLNKQIDEMTQVGIESYGETGASVDAETIAMAIKSLLIFDSQILVEISEIAFYKAIMNLIQSEEDFTLIQKIIQTKNQVRLQNLKSLSPELKETLSAFIDCHGPAEKVLPRIKALSQMPLVKGNQNLQDSMAYLENIVQLIKAYKLSSQLRIDITLKPDFDYYTGIIFKGYTQKYPEPICTGGRYDRGVIEALPAIGFAIKVDYLLTVMEEKKMYQNGTICIYEKDITQKSIKLAEIYREKGYDVDIRKYDSEKYAIDTASNRAVETVVIIDQETAKLINLRTEKIEKYPLGQVTDNPSLLLASESIH